jgi:uncharacterized protein (TIGR02099 family)
VTGARAWRIVAATLAAIVVGVALLFTGLRVGLAWLPRHVDKLERWVERQTQMRIEYERLDARLRWYGPEIVLHRLQVLDQDGTQALFATREGSVGLDLWNFLRTGEFVAGRVRFDEPRVTIVRLADGRIRLLGLRERPADRPPFDLDRLPAGRLVVTNAAVTYRDLRSGKPPLELRYLDAVLRRDRDYVVAEGSARLPQRLGERAQFEVRLKGSLDQPHDLDANAQVRVEELRLAGLDDLLPSQVAHPRAGRGSVQASLRLQQGRLADARAEFDLRDVELALPVRRVPPVIAVQVTEPRLERMPGAVLEYPTVTKSFVERPAPALPGTASYAVLRGEARLRHRDGTYTFAVDDLRAEGRAGPQAPPATRVAGSWRGHPQTRFALTAEVDDADLAALWPLVLAFAPARFDPYAGLSPSGRIVSLRVGASRERAGLPPAFRVVAEVAGLSSQPIARWPGIAGLTAKVAGDDLRGTVELRCQSPGFDWPRLFREPIVATRLDADLAWRREGSVWILGGRGVRVEHPQARAALDFELAVEKPGVSPELQMTATVDWLDATVVPRVIPAGRLRERTIAWIDRAFVRGTGSNGRLHYRGPVRKFPFRGGEGEFDASVQLAGLSLDYYPGFAPLTEAAGTARFHNAAIEAALATGQAGGLKLDRASFRIADYKWPVMQIEADATGDLRKALSFVQASPLGPRIGAQFMGLDGSGPARYAFRMTLPAMSQETLREFRGPLPPRDYLVRARLDRATVALPALRAPAQGVSGSFELHNDEIRSDGLRGSFLGGPFELTAAPGPASREARSVTSLVGRGRVGGDPLPAFIGLPATIRMSGSAEWELRGRIERRAPGTPWPLQFDVSSTLAGLGIAAPRPFAKAAGESRPTRVRLELQGRGVNDVTVETGSARARLRFASAERGPWRLERGTARFDGQPASLPAQPGLLVTGDWPQFDLAEWLALGDTGREGARPGNAPRLRDWLGPVDVHLDRATVYGFELRDVTARLRSAADTWQVGLSGPDASGEVSVPDDLARGAIVLDMERLHLRSGAEPVARSPGEATDPRRIPAISADVDDFSWQSRRFGRLQARIVRDPRGLTFESLRTTAPAFTIAARGSWQVEQGGPRTRLGAQFDSTDLAEAVRWLGYRAAVDARTAQVKASLWWPGGPSGDAVRQLNGTLQLALSDGKLRDVEPGAGRMLGLLSVTQLPRRLALDFRDVTDQGLAFDTVQGDFEVRAGNAYTENLLLRGPAVDIGVVGRTGLAGEDYEQTVVVSGNTGGPLAVAGALAAGPVVGAGVLVLSQLFKDQLQGLARAYYSVTGPWSAPVVTRIAAPPNEQKGAGLPRAAPAAAANNQNGAGAP